MVSSIFTILIGLLVFGVVTGLVILVFVSGFQIIISILGRILGFLGGVLGDACRFIWSIVGLLVSAPLSVCLLVLGRWALANRMARWFADSAVGLVRHPLNAIFVRPIRLIYLDRIADTVHDALPGADRVVVVAGGSENPSLGSGSEDVAHPTRSDQSPAVTVLEDGRVEFTDFEVVGELKPGGSGARLYVARPTEERRKKLQGCPEEVVIKSFVLQQGSTLPAIVRESRALESARSMGLVLEHHLDDAHFWYVMPYHAGDALSTTINRMHIASATSELRDQALRDAVSYVRDLVSTLVRFHQAGLWHKDVKPDNLIVHDGRAHLVDLGLVTSLQSPLTLTTHGTEYFRDPELVRMALRGVKVNDVDGTKFDVYGAGAVLYFVLENDFPAHGGLSDFTRDVPDSLRWIVRRAMADYNKRYERSEDLLADLDTVLASEDLWTVRPADLPSMQGQGAHGLAAAPPPPLVHVRRSRPAPPPHRTSRQSVVASVPVRSPRKVSVVHRAPVPTDRPSGMLVVLGLLAISVIVGLVATFMPPGGDKDASRAGQPALQVFGEDTSTMTLVDPDGDDRVLFVLHEDEHLESGELVLGVGKVIDWYKSNDYTLEPTSDLDALGSLLGEDETGESFPSVSKRMSGLLEKHGYTAVARVILGEDGKPCLRLVTSRNTLQTLPLESALIQVTPDDSSSDRLPDQSMADAIGHLWLSGGGAFSLDAQGIASRARGRSSVWTGPSLDRAA